MPIVVRYIFAICPADSAAPSGRGSVCVGGDPGPRSLRRACRRATLRDRAAVVRHGSERHDPSPRALTNAPRPSPARGEGGRCVEILEVVFAELNLPLVGQWRLAGWWSDAKRAEPPDLNCPRRLRAGGARHGTGLRVEKNLRRTLPGRGMIDLVSDPGVSLRFTTRLISITALR